MRVKKLQVSALDDIHGLFARLKMHKLTLTPDANRDFLYVVLMQIGPAAGQKIVKKRKTTYYAVIFDFCLFQYMVTGDL